MRVFIVTPYCGASTSPLSFRKRAHQPLSQQALFEKVELFRLIAVAVRIQFGPALAQGVHVGFSWG
jgi:hypothetical protein